MCLGGRVFQDKLKSFLVSWSHIFPWSKALRLLYNIDTDIWYLSFVWSDPDDKVKPADSLIDTNIQLWDMKSHIMLEFDTPLICSWIIIFYAKTSNRYDYDILSFKKDVLKLENLVQLEC